MRKQMWSAAATAALLAVAVPALVGPPPARAANQEVTMGSAENPYDLKFFPDVVEIAVGDTVTWRNLSDLEHDAKADNGAFDSKLLKKGETFQFKATTPGEISYVCTPHESAGMKGVVKVRAAGSTPTTAATTTTAMRTSCAAGSSCRRCCRPP